MSLPNCETLQLDLAEGVLTITLNRPRLPQRDEYHLGQ